MREKPGRHHTGLDLAGWRRVIAQSFAPLQIDPLGADPFRGDLRIVDLGEVHLFDMHATAHRVTRSQELVAAEAGGYYKLSLQVAGSSTMSQDGRTCVLGPGDLALYDSSRPYMLEYPPIEANATGQHSLVLTFPHSFVQLPPGDVALVTATPVGPHEGLGRVAAPLFSELAENLDLLRGAHAMRLVRGALDMLVTVLSSQVRHDPSDRGRALLVQQARAYIEDHLGDPDLSPSGIAAALYVSTRHLHTQFAAEELTVSAYIRARRLDAIRDDLANPVHARETVRTIAARHGLLDAARVSRLFKEQFGQTPSDFRESALADA